MTENAIKFLETLSADGEFTEKVTRVESIQEVIALAGEKDITLTEDDIREVTRERGKLDVDELNAVAGGGACACMSVGVGKQGTRDERCFCIGIGSGNEDKKTKKDDGPEVRCICVSVGGGESVD